MQRRSSAPRSLQGGSGGGHAEEASAQLRRAVREGDLAGVRAALAAGAQVNRAGEHLLALAVNSGQAEAMQARRSGQGWHAWQVLRGAPMHTHAALRLGLGLGRG